MPSNTTLHAIMVMWYCYRVLCQVNLRGSVKLFFNAMT
jgi:hypothetical protein